MDVDEDTEQEMTHAIRQPMPDLLKALHAKFGKNLGLLNDEVVAALDRLDTDLRTLSTLADRLASTYSQGEKHRCGSAEIVREAFSDLGQAMYLQSVGLIVPGRMATRRAFELGISSLYVWDLSHAYWGWTACDEDFSFSEMVSHLTSEAYLQMLKSQVGNENANAISNSECQKTYRALSNTVHGKHSDLPVLAPSRFETKTDTIVRELNIICVVCKIIISAWKARIPKCCDPEKLAVGA